MKAITYKNTKTRIPNWENTLHISNPRGYAYETPTHFVHFYGKDSGWFVISIGLTAIQKKQGTLENWVKDVFGAENIEPMDREVGESLTGVWRPSLYYFNDTLQALGSTMEMLSPSQQAIKLLIEKLDEIFYYIEPTEDSIKTYSHKTRELLILACTEVENCWQEYMREAGLKNAHGRGFSTNDYVNLKDSLFLQEYQFQLITYPRLPPIRAFYGWESQKPTESLSWYSAYNKTKHNRNNYFRLATLENCIAAVIASLTLYCVRYGPNVLFQNENLFSSLINQHFRMKLINSNPKTFYLPNIVLPGNIRNDLFVFDPRRDKFTQPFKQVSLIL
ncbi:hypothetical protein M2447_001560 [Ereboglobus sp. PH5-10]|uniref:hypothetical protein n=1 Tax=Ereboglobus sp. PH5-10 TaxID=2940629 RepID=UPI002406CED1|nr:hypothetical protein [Ereboglobus sp. PH5-10]MDF9827467.1 hypothetical protein [Ereboglobus sp. PH5-10]